MTLEDLSSMFTACGKKSHEDQRLTKKNPHQGKNGEISGEGRILIQELTDISKSTEAGWREEELTRANHSTRN